MKGSTQTALALGVGYVLGRQHKMRMATVLAAAAATGGAAGLSGALLKRGMKMLGSAEVLSKVAPQVGEIAETVRGDLLTVAKAAATEAVNNRIGSLSDSLHERAELVRNPGAAVAGAGEAAAGAGEAARTGAGEATRRLRRRGRGAARDEDTGAPRNEEEEPEFEEPDELEDDEREAAPRRSQRRPEFEEAGELDDDEREAAPRRSRRRPEFEEAGELDDDEREAAPRRSRTATRHRSGDEAPVRRSATRRQSPVARVER